MNSRGTPFVQIVEIIRHQCIAPNWRRKNDMHVGHAGTSKACIPTLLQAPLGLWPRKPIAKPRSLAIPFFANRRRMPIRRRVKAFKMAFGAEATIVSKISPTAKHTKEARPVPSIQPITTRPITLPLANHHNRNQPIEQSRGCGHVGLQKPTVSKLRSFS